MKLCLRELLLLLSAMQADVEPNSSGGIEDLSLVSARNGEWPNEGKVEFVDYCASYRPGILPDVLHSVSFVIQPREKVRSWARTLYLLSDRKRMEKYKIVRQVTTYITQPC